MACRAIVAVVVVAIGPMAACGGAAGHGAPPARSLREALEREIGAGRSVAIVAGTAGIRAVSSDGARQRTLVAEPASWVVVDPRADVLWFGNADTTELRAIDLAAPPAAPIEVHVIVEHLPPGHEVAAVGEPRYEIVHGDDGTGVPPGPLMSGGFGTASTDLMRASIALQLAPEPTVLLDAGYWPNDEWLARAAGITIRDRTFVIVVRERDGRAAPADERPPDAWVDGVSQVNCDDEGDCGKAQAIPGTRYWRVMTGNMMGDVRHVGWRLYDPAAKAMIDHEWAGWIADAWVAPDHAAFLVHGTVVRFDGGPVAATPPDQSGLGGGWLGGGTFYARFF